MTKPPANVLELPLEIRAEMALNAAVEKLIIENAHLGYPIYVWRDGGVVEISPEELKVMAARIEADRFKGLCGLSSTPPAARILRGS